MVILTGRTIVAAVRPPFGIFGGILATLVNHAPLGPFFAAFFNNADRIVEAGPAEDMLNSDYPFIRQFLAGEPQGPLTTD